MHRFAEERGLKLIHRFYELRPEGQPFPPPRAPEQVAEAWKHIREAAEKVGLDMRPNSRRIHSRLAIEGSIHAAQYDLRDDYDEKVFEAYFVKDEDISDIEVLVRIAGSVGLNINDFRECLQSRRYQEQVVADTAEFRRMGLKGIPCYLVDGSEGPGVHTVEELAELLDRK